MIVFIKKQIQWGLDLYDHAHSVSDPRVKNWLLMDGYLPTWLLVFAYLFIVWVGPKLMADRKAFTLRYPVFLYNVGMVALNFHICFELFHASYSLGYSYSCQPLKYSYEHHEYRILKALWWYYFSKCIEFIDTFFFILRKKDNQISFLHVYHHSTMFIGWWVGVKWVAGGQAFFGAMINSFIHVVMYSYYALSTLGPEFQKYLWWKRYLTKMQLTQFIVGMLHVANSLYVNCDFPKWMHWTLIAYGTSMLLLFLNFYHQAYIKADKARKAKRAAEANGKVTSNGNVKNGHVTNGHVTNGHVTNGHVTNGVSNGEAISNGKVETNGHISESKKKK